MKYQLLKQSNCDSMEVLELHVLARAYHSAWRRIHGSEPRHQHALPSLDLLIDFSSDVSVHQHSPSEKSPGADDPKSKPRGL